MPTIEQPGVWKVESSDNEVVLTAFGQRLTVTRHASGYVEVNGTLPLKSAPTAVNLKAVALRALEGTGFSVEGVKSRAKFRALNHARIGVMVALRRAGASYPEIGKFLDRNHGTVHKLCAKYGMLTSPLETLVEAAA